MTKVVFLQTTGPADSSADLERNGYYVGEIRALDGYLNEGYKVKTVTKIDINNFGVITLLVVLEK
jgi:hypothetical protein